MRANLYVIALILMISLKSYCQQNMWLGQPIHLDNIEVRKDSFDIRLNNKVSGYWIWETQKNKRDIIFKDISVLTGIVNEKLTFKLDKKKLDTASVDMSMYTRLDTLKVDLSRNTKRDIKANLHFKGRINKTMHVDSLYAKNVILRLEIFALLPAVTNYKGLNESLDTFFLNTGTVARMNLKYLKEEIVQVKAGTFNTYKIAFQAEGQTSNIIYINKELPHRIIKVELIGQPLTMELVKL